MNNLMNELYVRPVYGFGWFETGEPKTIKEPESFKLDLSNGFCNEDRSVILGQILDQGHVYSQMWVVLERRTTGEGGDQYNTYICDGKPEIALNGISNKSIIKITGFSEIK